MMVSAPETGQIPLSPSGLARIAAMAEQDAGLAIAPAKLSMVQTRLNRRLAKTGYRSFEDYLGFVATRAGSGERERMIAELTTNVSHFFRESHHFDALRDDFIPPLLDQGRPIRIWLAGCSSGQEPYSIAMVLIDTAERRLPSGSRVLATDIDPAVLARARDGTFPAEALGGLPALYAARFTGRDGETVRMDAALRRLVAFRCLNLIGPWPMKHPFDVIFCRNVTIYFGPAAQAGMRTRLAGALRPGGTLFLGHSERVHDPEGLGLSSSGTTRYRKVGRDTTGGG